MDQQDDPAGDDADFITLEVAVLIKVTAEQVSQALQDALDDDGDVADFEIMGVMTLGDGTLAVVAEVQVESGMAAMEWQRDLAQGSLDANLTLPLVDVLTLEGPPIAGQERASR